MSELPNSDQVDPDDRRKHLDYIQAVVTRMSLASSSAKSWLLPVVTATYGYSLTKKQGLVALVGIAGVLLISFLDANYLRQEKAYRRLYDVVARKTRPVPLFCLDPLEADDPIVPAEGMRARYHARLGKWFPDRKVWLSWAVAPFYGPLVLIGLLIAVFTA